MVESKQMEQINLNMMFNKNETCNRKLEHLIHAPCYDFKKFDEFLETRL